MSRARIIDAHCFAKDSGGDWWEISSAFTPEVVTYGESIDTALEAFYLALNAVPHRKDFH